MRVGSKYNMMSVLIRRGKLGQSLRHTRGEGLVNRDGD